jgi:phosphotransferase system HPr-like phosphotransfer protein
MIKSTDVKVRLGSVDDAKKFVEVMRGYDGDVDVSSSNKNYIVDGKSILGVMSLGLDHDWVVKFYDGITETYMTKLQPFMAMA